jgi:hypothetical protein
VRAFLFLLEQTKNAPFATTPTLPTQALELLAQLYGGMNVLSVSKA